MLSVADGEALSHVLSSPLDGRLKRLLSDRQEQLGADVWETARFVIVEAGDTPADLARGVGFSVFQNPIDACRYSESDYGPGWEWLAEHGYCFEMVWILDDSGFAHVVSVLYAERHWSTFTDCLPRQARAGISAPEEIAIPAHDAVLRFLRHRVSGTRQCHELAEQILADLHHLF